MIYISGSDTKLRISDDDHSFCPNVFQTTIQHKSKLPSDQTHDKLESRIQGGECGYYRKAFAQGFSPHDLPRSIGQPEETKEEFLKKLSGRLPIALRLMWARPLAT